MSVEKIPVVGSAGGGVSILFWNIHGQVTKSTGDKFADVEFLNVCKNFDILGISELHTNSKPNIKGFKLIKDKIRTKNHKGPKISGGIAVFAKKEIAHLIQLVPNDHEDSIWIKLSKRDTGEDKDLYIGTCYVSPPSKNRKDQAYGTKDKHSSLERFFEDAHQYSKKGEIILQGDMNARTGNEPDFLTNDKYDNYFGIENCEINPPRNSEDKKVCERGSLLLDLCKSGDYRIANGRKPGDLFGKFTSIQWNGSALVDYVITPASNLSRVVELRVGKFYPCLSDHCPLEYKIKLNINRKKESETKVDLQKIPPRCKWDMETKSSFLETLKSEEVSQTFETLRQENLSPEDGISSLSSVLLDCAGCDIGTSDGKQDTAHSKTRTSNDQPWFDKECRTTKKKINSLGKQLRRNPFDVATREDLFFTKRTFKNMVKRKKAMYKKDIIDKMHLTKQSEIKTFWKLLNKLDFDQINTKNAANDVSPTEWMEHYTNLFQGAAICKIPDNTAESGPLDQDITIEEIMDAKGILKPGKATGIDVINNEMILEALIMYPESFRNVMNILLKQGVGVTQWLTSLLVPIHKKGSTDDPDNYRGIALISCLAKLFYAILNNRLMDFCLKQNVLSPSQLGFLAGNRTSDAHIILHNLINEYCHKRKSRIYGCFVDFSKAFDSIPRDKMFQKLLDIGITGKFYDIVKYIYDGDQVCIKLNGGITPAIKTIMGVRQGCVLSPLLFNIYMADFPRSLSQNIGVQITNEHKMNCILWADDIIILSESEEGLNTLLGQLKDYSDLNQLKVNTEKTKCMIFNRTGRLIRRNFYLGSTKLECVRSYKYLGLSITPSGEIRSALDDLRSRALKAYMALKNKLGTCFRDHIDDTIGLFNAMIKPILLYGSDFWGCLKLPRNNPVENLYMQFCRQVLGVQKNTTNVGVLLELGCVPLMLEAQRLSLKNWERIKNGDGNILVGYSFKNSSEKELDWNRTICTLLSEHGMRYRITENFLDTGDAFLGKAKDIYHQEAFTQINKPESKLRTYALIKTDIGREPYLSEIRNAKHRQKLSKFRLSNHKLLIETGRHMKLPKTERICPICKEGIEDELHFLVRCNFYESERKSLLDKCIELRPNFDFYSDEEKFHFIMTTPVLMGNVSKFIYSAMNERDIYHDVSITLNGILDKVPC